MEQITISGTLATKAESCTDKNGKKYSRFTVTCKSEDIYGRVHFTHYWCTCYVPGYEKKEKGDQIFLTGKLSAKIGFNEDGKPYLNLNVMVYQATEGFTALERNQKTK